MSKDLMRDLVTLLHSGCAAVGLAAAAVSVDARGTISLAGTGIEIWWSGAQGGPPGWKVRESCHVTDLASGAERTAVAEVSSHAAGDIYGAAKSALMAAVQRRIEAAFSDALGA